MNSRLRTSTIKEAMEMASLGEQKLWAEYLEIEEEP